MIGLMGMVALGAPPLFEPVTTDLGGGAVVNWTDVRLEITASAERSGSEGTRALEELARRAVDLRVTDAARTVPVSPHRTLGDLERQPELWPSLQPRIGRWVETENRYGSSGRVEVVGALSLVELLKPVTMSVATANQAKPTARSGVTLDARGKTVEPCFAPEILGPGGEVVYAGRMWLDAAVEHAPAVWVTDAAAPEAGRSGANPMLALVADAHGCQLTLDARATEELRGLVASGRLGEGTLVVVVDP